MPSPKILEKKKQAVDALAAELKNAQSIVLNDYMGLNVAEDTEMRTAFRLSLIHISEPTRPLF